MSGPTPNPTLPWRTSTGRWRWIILGALGVAPNACGGRTQGGDPEPAGGNLEGHGGSSNPSHGGVGNINIAAYGGANADGGTGGTGSGGFAYGGQGGTAVTTRSNCEAPITVLGGGWKQCANGMLHRTSVGACESSLPRPERVTGYDGNPVPDAGTAGYPPPYCLQDADCTDAPNGHCELGQYEGGTYCEYGCITNADCGAGSVCLCDDAIGRCVSATCSTDAECGSGLLCSDYVTDPGCGGMAFACQLPSDSCAAQSDCNPGLFCSRVYRTPSDTWAPTFCVLPGCAIGRPFLVDGRERLASEVSRADWYPAGPASNDVQVAPSAELRAAIVRGWTEQALMEHASVAAFARFSLQLLSLGAPPHLLVDAARAMQDETEHARACFELARRYRGADVGPGPLTLDGAFEPEDMAAIVLSTIAEGCIGETVAAIEAAEAAAHCEDEAARTVLERIAVDETRHAELAWGFVAWALRTGPASLRERARAAFDAALSSPMAARAPNDFELELARYGLFGPALRQACRERVLAEVIAPSARALIETSEPGAVTASSSSSAKKPAPAGA